MFKRLFCISVLILGIFLLYPVAVKADEGVSISDSLKQIPSIKQGVAWSFADNKLNYLATAEILSYKGFSLEAGYAGDADSTDHKAVAVLSYDLLNLKKLGVNVPILDLLDFRVGGYVGYGRVQIGTNEERDGNNQFDYGASVTAISLKF